MTGGGLKSGGPLRTIATAGAVSSTPPVISNLGGPTAATTTNTSDSISMSASGVSPGRTAPANSAMTSNSTNPPPPYAIRRTEEFNKSPKSETPTNIFEPTSSSNNTQRSAQTSTNMNNRQSAPGISSTKPTIPHPLASNSVNISSDDSTPKPLATSSTHQSATTAASSSSVPQPLLAPTMTSDPAESTNLIKNQNMTSSTNLPGSGVCTSISPPLNAVSGSVSSNASSTTHKSNQARPSPNNTSATTSQTSQATITPATSSSNPTSTTDTPNNTTTSNLRKILTLDAEVDIFLSGPSFRADKDEPSALPLLRPPPLSIHDPNTSQKSPTNAVTSTANVEDKQDTDSVYKACQELVQRRAWGDVVTFSMNILTSSQYDYEKYYSQIINSVGPIDLGDDDDEDDDAISDKKDETGESNNVGAVTSASISPTNNTSYSSLTQRRTIQILHWRIRAMIHLRRYADLKREIQRFNFKTSSLSNLQYECDKLSFPSLIMDAIQARQYSMAASVASPGTNKNSSQGSTIAYEWNMCVDELYLLQQVLEKKDDWKSLWLIHLYIILSNVYTRGQEWRMALLLLEKALGCVSQHVHYFISHIKSKKEVMVGRSSLAEGFRDMTMKQTTEEQYFTSSLCRSLRIQIYSRQGRILLQAGALPEAAIVFERAHDEYQSMKKEQKPNLTSELPMIRNVPIQILLNEGLLHFAHMDYELAEEKFQKGADCLQKNDPDSVKSNETKNDYRLTIVEQLMNETCLEFESIFQAEEDLLEPCMNNLALCMLYKCRMREAVDLMESLVRTDPTKFLTGTMAFNLCTLYELGSDNTVSDKKKKILQLIAKRFLLHDIGIECFRL